VSTRDDFLGWSTPASKLGTGKKILFPSGSALYGHPVSRASSDPGSLRFPPPWQPERCSIVLPIEALLTKCPYKADRILLMFGRCLTWTQERTVGQSAPVSQLSPGQKKFSPTASYGHLVTRASQKSGGVLFSRSASSRLFFSGSEALLTLAHTKRAGKPLFGLSLIRTQERTARALPNRVANRGSAH